MFKRSLAILLLFVITASGFQRYIVYGGFELNRDYIAKNLCVNKSRPWLHCNGKCYLMRKVKEVQENERKQAAQDNINRAEVFFFQPPAAFNFLSFNIENPVVSYCDTYTCLYTNQYITSLFRPPKSLA